MTPEEQIDPALTKLLQESATKAIVKLDKNFHVYRHGSHKNIEAGTDKKGKFIKLYYEEIN